MGCLTGAFDLPGSDCLGETLLAARGKGAVACWGSSALLEPSGQEQVLRQFLAILEGRERPTVGEATREAMVRAWADRSTGRNILRAFSLLGDPATRLR